MVSTLIAAFTVRKNVCAARQESKPQPAAQKLAGLAIARVNSFGYLSGNTTSALKW